MKKIKTLRHDWKTKEVKNLFNLSLNDLLYKAHSVHKESFKSIPTSGKNIIVLECLHEEIIKEWRNL